MTWTEEQQRRYEQALAEYDEAAPPSHPPARPNYVTMTSLTRAMTESLAAANERVESLMESFRSQTIYMPRNAGRTAASAGTHISASATGGSAIIAAGGWCAPREVTYDYEEDPDADQ